MLYAHTIAGAAITLGGSLSSLSDHGGKKNHSNGLLNGSRWHSVAADKAPSHQTANHRNCETYSIPSIAAFAYEAERDVYTRLA